MVRWGNCRTLTATRPHYRLSQLCSQGVKTPNPHWELPQTLRELCPSNPDSWSPARPLLLLTPIGGSVACKPTFVWDEVTEWRGVRRGASSALSEGVLEEEHQKHDRPAEKSGRKLATWTWWKHILVYNSPLLIISRCTQPLVDLASYW